MQPQTNVMAFLIETYKRMAVKSPKFFQVFQTIGLIAGLITGVPTFLEFIGVVLPPEIEPFAAKTVAAAAWVMWFMAKLPATNPVAPTDSKGNQLNATQVLPFTSQVNDKQAA